MDLENSEASACKSTCITIVIPSPMDVRGFFPQGVGPGGGCSSGITGQCVDNATCDSAKCQCNSDYYADSGQCHQRKYW